MLWNSIWRQICCSRNEAVHSILVDLVLNQLQSDLLLLNQEIMWISKFNKIFSQSSKFPSWFPQLQPLLTCFSRKTIFSNLRLDLFPPHRLISSFFIPSYHTVAADNFAADPIPRRFPSSREIRFPNPELEVEVFLRGSGGVEKMKTKQPWAFRLIFRDNDNLIVRWPGLVDVEGFFFSPSWKKANNR